MNYTKLMKSLIQAALVLGLLVLAPGPSFAATYNLAAVGSQWLPPGGTAGVDEITMWGFVTDTGSCPVDPVDWQPGPTLQPTDGSMTITLRNCLSEPVSIVIPGQAAIGTPVWDGDRVRSFTNEVSASSTASYTWTGVKAGTYLYQSGTHPAKQVHMGLYGALIVDAVAATASEPAQVYPGEAYDSQVVLLYSEIDPALHDPPAVPTPLDYIPAYYLINGKPYEADDLPVTAGNVSQNTLIRFINAGLKTHVPTLLNAPYMRVIAEDGNLYPYAKTQYSVLLAAGKTMDAIWSPTVQGTYPLIDRANYLTTAGVTDGGNYAYLQVGTAGGAPVAAGDSATVAEGGTVTALNGGETSVLANDTGADLVAVLVGNVSNGLLTLDSSGTFSYTHNGGQTTTDSFTYKARNTVSLLESNVATVSITVTPANDPPVANPDAYNAVAGTTLTVAAPGVLGNDSDVDGDALTAILNTNVTGGELITLNSDGSFSYTANSGTTLDSFTYHANDGANDSNVATVTITVSAPVNTAPVAADDFATTTKNTAVFINLVVNDTDAENNLKDAFGDVAADQISIVTNPTRGGTVSVLTNGMNYTPKKNFRGTDVFTYTVSDIEGLPSNTATVRVNVTNN